MSNWNESTGGLDNFHLTVKRSYFGTNANYNNGQSLLLNWEGPTDLEQAELKDSFVVSFPCGKGWLTDDGSRAYHEGGEAITERGFNKSSILGKLKARALGDLGLGDELQAKGDQFDATVWEGYTFLMRRETIEFGAGLEPRERLMPVEVVNSPSTSTQQKAVGQIASVRLAKVKATAKSIKSKGGSHQDFVDEAMGIDGVADDNDLLEAIVDEASGVWATA